MTYLLKQKGEKQGGEKKREQGFTDIHSQTFPNLQEIENKIGNDLKLTEATIGVLGGFSSTNIRRRKPMYGAVMPGSKIQVEANDQSRSVIAREAIGLFSNIGFGSLI